MKSLKSRNQGFLYYFCLMIEGSGSGSIPLTNGSRSGPGRPKYMRIRWIRIRIRIRNTPYNSIYLNQKILLFSKCGLLHVVDCVSICRQFFYQCLVYNVDSFSSRLQFAIQIVFKNKKISNFASSVHIPLSDSSPPLVAMRRMSQLEQFPKPAVCFIYKIIMKSNHLQ
jgi:hypothetical protein